MVETVELCPFCRCKTWHVDGACEWSDSHKVGAPNPSSEPKQEQQEGERS